MSRKIATPAAVFSACDRLESYGEPWNRDDVRAVIGGGGFNVIDPLIRTWRKLRPVKELAPATPTELLYLVAEAMDGHLGQHMTEIQRRETERSCAYDAAVDELTDTIAELEQQTQTQQIAMQQLSDDNTNMQQRLSSSDAAIAEREQRIAILESERDNLSELLERERVEAKSIAEQLIEAKSQCAQLQAGEKSWQEEIQRLKNEQSLPKKSSPDSTMDLLTNAAKLDELQASIKALQEKLDS